MRRQIAIISIIITTFAALAGPVLAAPSITGTNGVFTHGQSVTVSGSGFGTHADYHDANQSGQLNFAWKNFEDNSFSSAGWYPHEEACLSYTDTHFTDRWDMGTGGRTNNLYYAHRHASTYDNENICGLSRTATLPLGNEFFVSYWYRIGSGNCASSGQKIIRFTGSDDPSCDYYMATGGGGCSTRSSANGCGPTNWGGAIDYPTDTWIRVDIYMNSVTPRQTLWIVGRNSNAPVFDTSAPITPSLAAGNMLGVNLGEGADSTGTDESYDDAYIDFTQARAEICDSPTWSARTNCEVQIPTAWNSNGQSIAVKINKGSFVNGSTAYLYVLDSTGAVNSSGYQITFGSGTSDTTAPASPTGLSVM